MVSMSITTQHQDYSESREAAAVRRLRGLLGEWRISDSELARRMHRSQTWVSARLNLRTHTQVDDFDEFARALGVTTAWVLGFDDQRPGGPRLSAAPLFQQPIVRQRDYKGGHSTVTHVDFSEMARRRSVAAQVAMRR